MVHPPAGAFWCLSRLTALVNCCMVGCQVFSAQPADSHSSQASPKLDYTPGSSRPTYAAATPGVDSSDKEEMSCGGLAWEDIKSSLAGL